METEGAHEGEEEAATGEHTESAPSDAQEIKVLTERHHSSKHLRIKVLQKQAG